MTAIRQLLRQVRSRVVGEQALRWSANGAALAGLGALASEIVFRRWPLDLQWLVLASWVLAGAIFALAGWRRTWPSWVQVARLADARLGGSERLVTALEFAAEGGWLYQRQRQDAAAFAGSARLSDLGPLRWPWRTLGVALAAGLAATVLALLPNPALQQLKQHQAAVAAQDRAGDQVAAISRQAAGQTRPGEDPQKRQALTQDLKKASEAVRKAPDPQSALASLSQAQDQLRELQDPAPLGARQDAAAAAGRALTGNPQAARAGSALAGQDMKSAQKELNNLAGSLPSMNEQQRQQLADSLARASASAGGDPKLQQSLKNASDSLKKGDVQAAQQSLQAAAQEAQSVGASEDFQGDVNQAINGLQQAKGPLAQQASGQQSQAGQGQDQAQNAAGQGVGAAGQGAPGQGQGAPGQGQGQGAAGQGPGQGSGAAGEGQGAAGQGGQGGSGSGANGSGGGSGTAGSKPGAGSEKVYVPGQAQGTSGNGTPDGTGQGVQNDLVPYDQVLGQYQSAALSQVDRADIPEQERQLVQQYFTNLSK